MASKTKKTKGTPDSVDIHVGQRLKIKRSLMGWSQEKLAESIGLTFQQIQKYERGMNRMSAGRLYEFSNIFGVPVAYFFEGLKNTYTGREMVYGFSDTEQEGINDDDDLMNRKETLDLVRLYYSIEDQEMRKDIFKFIKSMATRNLDR